MHSTSLTELAYLIALTSSISAAVISPVSVLSRDTTSSDISIDDSTNSSSSSSSSSDMVLTHSLTSTSFTSLDVAQPSFCPYDSLNQPQPLLSYDVSTAPLAADCAHILDIINDTQPRGYWTFDTSDLEKGITLIGHRSCAFEMIKDEEVGEGGDGKNNSKKGTKQVKWGVEELKFYLGTWLQKQRHGRLGAVGEVDCWVEGDQKKEEGGVRVRWMVVRRQQ